MAVPIARAGKRKADAPVSFVDTMELERIDAQTYRSVGQVFVHLEGVFGGHLLAQSAYAASKTVGPEYYCHNLSSHFLVQGTGARPLVYHIENIRNGKSFCSRLVHIRQPTPDGSNNDIIFTAIIAFKTPEPQRSLDTYIPSEDFSWILKDPRRFPVEPLVDVPVWSVMAKKHGLKPPNIGVEIRIVDMTEKNKSKPLHEHRRVTVYKVIGKFPDPKERLALSIGTHMYASDRNCMFALIRPHNLDDELMQTASLNCTIMFHTDPKLLICDGDEDWFIVEGYNDRAADGRGLARLRIWNRHGVLLASVVQDVLMRVRMDGPVAGDKRKTIGERIRAMM